MKTQSNEIDLLEEDINSERRETETFRLKNEKLKMSVKSGKTTNKMLRVEIDTLKQELETQRKKYKDTKKELANEVWEKTKTGKSC